MGKEGKREEERGTEEKLYTKECMRSGKKYKRMYKGKHEKQGLYMRQKRSHNERQRYQILKKMNEQKSV